MRLVDPDGRVVQVASNAQGVFREGYQRSEHFRAAVNEAAQQSQTVTVKLVGKVRQADEGAATGNESYIGKFRVLIVRNAKTGKQHTEIDGLAGGEVEVKAGQGTERTTELMGHGLTHFSSEADADGPLDGTPRDRGKNEASADWQEDRISEDLETDADDLTDSETESQLSNNEGIVFETNKQKL
jgi:hypothetical protein